jgi:tetratricopeptide (TPR) repeat protein/4-amino-4-deoxy-L-arabinose transferase-like glycosyltransferase
VFKYIQMKMSTIFIANKYLKSRSLNRELMLILVVVFLAVPVFFLKEGSTGSDMSSYLALGRKISVGEGYIAPPVSIHSSTSQVRSPLYPSLFALAFFLFGTSVASAQIVTKALAFGSILVVYLLLKKLYNYKVGLVTSALFATSSYLLSFSVHLYIDQAMAFFMLLSLYLLVLSFDKTSLILGMLAGVSLALGVLIKELAILWLPVPFFLFLAISEWRRSVNAPPLAVYYLGFSIPVGAWWFYYYFVTGEILLFSTYAHLPWSSIILFFLILIFICLSLIFLIFRYNFRNKIQAWLKRFWLLSNPFLIWFVWIFITAVFSYGLILRTRFPISSISEIPNRLLGFLDFIERTTIWEPQFRFLGIAVIIFIISAFTKKHLGNKVLFWSFQALWPLALMNLPGSYELKIRYGLPYQLLFFMVLGVALIAFLDFVNSFLSSRFRYIRLFKPLHLTNIGVGLLVAYGVLVSWDMPRTYPYYNSPYYINIDNNVVEIHQTAEWIRENLPEDVRMAADFHHIRPLEFLTDGYIFERWFSLESELTNIFWPYQRFVRVENNNGELGFYGVGRGDYRVNIPKPLYLQRMITRLHDQYTALSEDALLSYLQEFQIDYLVLTLSSAPNIGLIVQPDYFNDHPAFDMVYATSWGQRNSRYGITIYKIDRSNLISLPYPSMITTDAWLRLSEDGELLLEEFSTLSLLNAIGGGPILFRPASVANFEYYDQVGKAYIEQGEIDLAALQYHLALKEAPNYAGQVAPRALQWTNLYPDLAGPWLMLGDYRLYQGLEDLALEAYRTAAEATNGSNLSFSAAHYELGKLYLFRGEYAESTDHFERALELSIFGWSEFEQQLIVARALQLSKSGEIDQAIANFNQAFEFDDNNSTDTDIHYDFLWKLNDAELVLGNPNSIHPSVLIIDDQPHKVLLAHPPSTIRYDLQLPSKATIIFSPSISPEVWKPGKGDGVQFELYLDTSDGTRYRLYNEYLDPKNLPEHRQWLERQVDLSHWSGETVTISFVTGCGPNDDCRYDWAGWGEPRLLQPVYYDFLDNFSEENLQTGEIDLARRDELTIDYETRPILFQHPTSQVVYNLTLPQQPTLKFGLGMDPQVWGADKGDGVEYNIYVRQVQEPYRLVRVFQRYLDPKNNPADRRWFDERLDLSRFGGQQVDIIFEALPGPADDYAFDWGGWSAPVLIDDTLPGREVETGSIPLFIGTSP